MEKYYELEVAVIGCLVVKPELMKELKIDETYFIKYKRMFNFMKAFYKKFETFDVVLMASVCGNKNTMLNYFVDFADCDFDVHNFKKYEERIIEMKKEIRSEELLISNIYKLATELYVHQITLGDFKKRYETLCEKGGAYEDI